MAKRLLAIISLLALGTAVYSVLQDNTPTGSAPSARPEAIAPIAVQPTASPLPPASATPRVESPPSVRTAVEVERTSTKDAVRALDVQLVFADGSRASETAAVIVEALEPGNHKPRNFRRLLVEDGAVRLGIDASWLARFSTAAEVRLSTSGTFNYFAAQSKLPIAHLRSVPSVPNAALDDPTTKASSVDLVVASAVMLHGQVVDATGRPIEARVFRGSTANEASWHQAFRGPSTDTRKDGRFDIELTRPSSFRLYAVPKAGADASGVAVGAEPVVVEPGVLLDHVVLQLRGSGVLRGRVLDSSRRPRAGDWLLIEHEDVRHRQERLGEFVFDASPFTLSGGLRWKHTTTDLNGLFEVAGLEPGAYHVWTFLGRGANEERRLTNAPLFTGDMRHELVDQSLALRVRLVDEAGQPFLDFELGEEEIFEERLHDWKGPLSSGLVLLGREPHGPQNAATEMVQLTPGARFVVPWGERQPSGEVLYSLPGPGLFDLQLALEDRPFVRREVDVRANSGTLDVELVVPPAQARGTWLVDIVGASGEDVHAGVARLFAMGASTPSEVLTFEETPLRLELPVGHYTLEVEEQRDWMALDEESPWYSRFGRARVDVKVESGALRETTIRLPLGAHMEVTSTSAWSERYLKLLLLDPSGTVHPVHFFPDVLRDLKFSHGGPSTAPHVPSGTHLSGPLPAGTFTLVGLAQGQGVKPAFQLEVTLRAGETTSLVVPTFE